MVRRLPFAAHGRRENRSKGGFVRHKVDRLGAAAIQFLTKSISIGNGDTIMKVTPEISAGSNDQNAHWRDHTVNPLRPMRGRTGARGRQSCRSSDALAGRGLAIALACMVVVASGLAIALSSPPGHSISSTKHLTLGGIPGPTRSPVLSRHWDQTWTKLRQSPREMWPTVTLSLLDPRPHPR